MFAVSMVKDEADIIAATVGHMLTQVDEIIVADNMSSDGTRDILNDLGPRVHVIDDHEIGYYQSRKMTELARRAVSFGATWVVPFDADEYWCSRWGTVAEVLRSAECDYGIVTAELYDHVATGWDPASGDPIDRLPWRRQHALPLPKVAVRADPDMVIEQGNHWARLPIPPRHTDSPRLVVHHYPYRSVEQVIRKVRNGSAAYAATEGIPDNVGAHWRQWGAFSDEQIADLFRVWYWRDVPTNPYTPEGGEQQEPLIMDSPRRCR